MPRMKDNRLPNMLAFNGSSDFMTLPIVPSVTGFNLAFWAIERNFTDNARIIDWQDSGPANGFTVVETTAKNVQFRCSNAGVTNGNIADIGYVNGKLRHYVVTHDGTTAKLYCDSVLIGTDNSSVFTAAAATFSVGRRAGGGNSWNGKLGELVFQNTVTPWTAQQVSDLYFYGLIPSGASYWLFNGDVLDGSGNGNHGTLTGGTYIYQGAPRVLARNIGGSTLFNGTTSKIDCGATDIIGTGDVTVSAWIKLSGWGELTGRIIDNGKFFFRVSDTAGQKAILVASDGANASCGSANSSLMLGKWFHVVATRNSAGLVNVYINGNRSGAANQDSGTPAAATTNTIIGNDTAAGKTFNGKIAEVKIFNSILTSSQAQELYVSGNVSGITPIASYALNDTPSTYIDSIGGNNGTGTNTTLSTDVPIRSRSASTNRVAVQPFTGSAQFDGSASYLTLPFVPDLTGFTVMLRAKIMAGFTNGSILFDWESAADRDGISLKFDTSSMLLVCVGSTASAPDSILVSTTKLIYGRWYNLAFTYQPNQHRLYVNAVLERTDSAIVVTANATTPTLGKRSYGATGYGKCKISDFAYCDDVLTQTEIAAFFRDGAIPVSLKNRWKLDDTAGSYVDVIAGATGTGTSMTKSTDAPTVARTSV